jgi:hypothetical protein
MKFSHYYEELITERRYTDDKFEVITKKMPNWLLDEFGGDPNMVVRMPMYSDFRKYLLDRGEDVTNNEDVILGFSYLEDWLNEIDGRLSQKFLTLISQRYPVISEKIKNWNKPDDWVKGPRGRKPGSKNKPKTGFADLSMTQTMDVEPSMAPTMEPSVSSEPKRRGRKPAEGSLRKLEDQYEKMQDDLEKHVMKMRELMRQINQRRSYFGKNE